MNTSRKRRLEDAKSVLIRELESTKVNKREKLGKWVEGLHEQLEEQRKRLEEEIDKTFEEQQTLIETKFTGILENLSVPPQTEDEQVANLKLSLDLPDCILVEPQPPVLEMHRELLSERYALQEILSNMVLTCSGHCASVIELKLREKLLPGLYATIDTEENLDFGRPFPVAVVFSARSGTTLVKFHARKGLPAIESLRRWTFLEPLSEGQPYSLSAFSSLFLLQKQGKITAGTLDLDRTGVKFIRLHPEVESSISFIQTKSTLGSPWWKTREEELLHLRPKLKTLEGWRDDSKAFQKVFSRNLSTTFPNRIVAWCPSSENRTDLWVVCTKGKKAWVTLARLGETETEILRRWADMDLKDLPEIVFIKESQGYVVLAGSGWARLLTTDGLSIQTISLPKTEESVRVEIFKEEKVVGFGGSGISLRFFDLSTQDRIPTVCERVEQIIDFVVSGEVIWCLVCLELTHREVRIERFLCRDWIKHLLRR